MSDFNEFKDSFLRAVGVDPKLLDLPEDPDGAEIFVNLSNKDQRKVRVGLALMQLQIPDEVRYTLLTNHLDETERLVEVAYQDLSASLVNKLAQAGDAETKSTLGSVRLAMLMNILGFDDATLKGVLTDPILARRASLVAVTCMNEMGQKIQQMYDEKNNEPT